MLVVDKKTGKAVATPATGKGTDAAAFDPKLGFAFASNGEGTLTVVRRVKGGTYEAAANIQTRRGVHERWLSIPTATGSFSRLQNWVHQQKAKPGPASSQDHSRFSYTLRQNRVVRWNQRMAGVSARAWMNIRSNGERKRSRSRCVPGEQPHPLSGLWCAVMSAKETRVLVRPALWHVYMELSRRSIAS